MIKRSEQQLDRIFKLIDRYFSTFGQQKDGASAKQVKNYLINNADIELVQILMSYRQLHKQDCPVVRFHLLMKIISILSFCKDRKKRDIFVHYLKDRRIYYTQDKLQKAIDIFNIGLNNHLFEQLLKYLIHLTPYYINSNNDKIQYLMHWVQRHRDQEQMTFEQMVTLIKLQGNTYPDKLSSIIAKFPFN